MSGRSGEKKLVTDNSFKKIWECFFNYQIENSCKITTGGLKHQAYWTKTNQNDSQSGNDVQKYKGQTTRIDLLSSRFLINTSFLLIETRCNLLGPKCIARYLVPDFCFTHFHWNTDYKKKYNQRMVLRLY